MVLAILFRAPESVQAMNLNNAVGQAVNSNPEIKSHQSEERAVEHQIDQEFGGYGPQVNVEHGSGFEYTKDNYKKNELNTTALKGKVDETRHQPTVKVVQPILVDLTQNIELRKKKMNIHKP